MIPEDTGDGRIIRMGAQGNLSMAAERMGLLRKQIMVSLHQKDSSQRNIQINSAKNLSGANLF